MAAERRIAHASAHVSPYTYRYRESGIMRLFEWFVCLSFVPTLVLPFIAQWWRQRGLLSATLLPVLAIMLHLAIEGWRTQMIPVYILGALVVAGRLRALLNRTHPGPRTSGRLISAANAEWLTMARCWSNGQAQLDTTSARPWPNRTRRSHDDHEAAPIAQCYRTNRWKWHRDRRVIASWAWSLPIRRLSHYAAISCFPLARS